MAVPALITYKTTSNVLWSLIVGAIGAIPDIINNKYYKIAPSINFYNILHRPWLHFKKWWVVVYAVLWPIGLHCLCDWPFHTDTDGMRNLRVMIAIEFGFWMIILAWICLR